MIALLRDSVEDAKHLIGKEWNSSRVDETDQPSTTADGWAERWSDRGLQQLGRWLTRQGTPDVRAALAVETLWVFYSYAVLPILRYPIQLGIAGRRDERGVNHVWLCLPSIRYAEGILGADQRQEDDFVLFVLYGIDGRSKGLAADQHQLKELQEAFRREVADTLGDTPALNLALLETESMTSFESDLRRQCKDLAVTYVGVFVDHLEAELRMIMRPEELPAWLASPNTLFGGKPPAALLRYPAEDRPLRDLLLAARHSIAS